MLPSSQLQVIDSDTEPDRPQRNLIELMREAVDGSGSFMSRRARQILLEEFRIVVVTFLSSITFKACFGKFLMAVCKGFTA